MLVQKDPGKLAPGGRRWKSTSVPFVFQRSSVQRDSAEKPADGFVIAANGGGVRLFMRTAPEKFEKQQEGDQWSDDIPCTVRDLRWFVQGASDMHALTHGAPDFNRSGMKVQRRIADVKAQKRCRSVVLLPFIGEDCRPMPKCMARLEGTKSPHKRSLHP